MDQSDRGNLGRKVSLSDLTTAQGWLQTIRPLPPEVTQELRHRSSLHRKWIVTIHPFRDGNG